MPSKKDPIRRPVEYVALEPLARSRPAVWCALIVCLAAAVASIFFFVAQLFYTDVYGRVFRDQPGAWPHLLGHLFRCAIAVALAVSLWLYLRALRSALR